jgi:hypothetical protein
MGEGWTEILLVVKYGVYTIDLNENHGYFLTNLGAADPNFITSNEKHRK